MNSHHGAFTALSPSNQYPSRDRGNSHHGGGGINSHNFHPSSSDQLNSSNQNNTNAGHSIVHGSNNYHLRDREGAGNSRHMVGASLD